MDTRGPLAVAFGAAAHPATSQALPAPSEAKRTDVCGS